MISRTVSKQTERVLNNHRRKDFCKIFLFVLFVMFCILGLSSALADYYSFNYTRNDDKPDGSTSYYHISFDYNDSMLLTNATTNSSKLTKASVALATAAYNQQSIVNLARQLGYTKLNAINYSEGSVTLADADHVGYLLSEKEVTINNVGYIIYLVPIRGTISSNAEWFSDFNIGSTRNHEGFYNAAAEVLRNLQGRISANEQRYDADHTIVWLMGHSRGAAVSNIVSGKLTEKARNNTIGLKPEHIHSYNFACPAVSMDADVNIKNIHNYINELDLIPTMPAQDWGYRRYGQAYDTKQDFSDDPDFSYHFSQSHYDSYDSYEKDTVYDALVGIIGSPENLNNPAVHALVDLALKAMVAPDSSVTGLDILAKHFGTKSFISSLLDWVSEQLAPLSALERTRQLGNIIGSFAINSASILSQTDIDDLKNLKAKYNEFINIIEQAGKGIFDAHTPETYINWLNRDGYGYNLRDEKIEGDYVLPTNVTTICPDMFCGNVKLTSVTLHQNITNIDNLSFGGCSNLVSVIFQGNTITSFPAGLFANCTNLKTVSIPSKLESIGNATFVSCSSLESISFPTTMKKMGDANFYGCDKLESASIPGLEEMGSACFSNCPLLTNIELPNSLRSIGDDCFTNCVSLRSINIPASLQNWGTALFHNCSSLNSLVLENNLTSIGAAAFYNCDALETVVIPDTVHEIGNSAWGDCSNLKNITVPVDINNMSSVFYNCPVENVTFTKGKTGIMLSSVYAFCRTVKKVVFSNGVTHIGITCLPGDGVLEDVQFPDSLQEIGDYAFVNQTHLVKLKFPAGIRKLGTCCFAGCSGLNAVIFSGSIPSDVESVLCDNADIFAGTNPALYIPHGTSVSNNLLLTYHYYCPSHSEGYLNYSCVFSNRQEPTCSQNGFYSYPYCPFCGMIFTDTTLSTQATQNDYVIPASHKWGDPDYIWSEDSNVLIARHYCLLNNEHIMDETISNILCLPNTLTTIENEAFENLACQAVIIPNSCTSIGHHAFRNCKKLKYVRVPANTSVPTDAFDGCSNVSIERIQDE